MTESDRPEVTLWEEEGEELDFKQVTSGRLRTVVSQYVFKGLVISSCTQVKYTPFKHTYNMGNRTTGQNGYNPNLATVKPEWTRRQTLLKS